MSEEQICAICQDPLDESPTFTIPTCKHNFHTNCLFTNYCHGNISCAICRTLPITNLDVEDTLQNISISYDEQNIRDEEKFFRKGVNAVHKGNCKSSKLVKAVKRYDAFQAHVKKMDEKEKARKKVRQQFVKDCNAAIQRVLKLKRYEKLKSEYNINTFKHLIRGYTSIAVNPIKKRRRVKKYKSLIAKHFGFTPLTVN